MTSNLKYDLMLKSSIDTHSFRKTHPWGRAVPTGKKSKVKTRHTHKSIMKIWGTGRRPRSQSQHAYCLARRPQPDHCLLWASISSSKRNERFRLSQNALIPWNIQHQAERINVNFEDGFSGSPLDFLFYKVAKKWKKKSSCISTEQIREEGNIWIGDKCGVAICYWNTRKDWARNKFTQEIFRWFKSTASNHHEARKLIMQYNKIYMYSIKNKWRSSISLV